MKWARLGLWAVVAAAVVFLLVAAALALLEIKTTTREVRRTLERAGNVLDKVNTAADHAITAEDQQIASWKLIDQEIKKTVGDLHDLTIHTDLRLNGTDNHPELGLLPNFTHMMANVDREVVQLQGATQAFQGIAPTAQGAIAQLAQDSHQTLLAGQEFIQAGTADLQDKALHDAASQIATAAGNLNGMSADGKKITADMAAWVHRELAPIRGTWNTIRAFIGTVAGPLAAVATAVK